MIIISKIHHKSEVVILLRFEYDETIISNVKTLPNVRYSNTHKGWYMAYSRESWADFLKLGLEYKIDNELNTEKIEVQIVNDNSGTAPSPKSSDIAGIAVVNYDTAISVHPSNGDSKGTDIHQSKGGRSITYNQNNFFITIHYNQEDITFLKTMKGYWQSKIRKWIVKGTIDNLEKLQNQYQFWEEENYNKIRELLLNVECPYLVTLYRTSEDLSSVIVQIAGHKANTRIIAMVTERQYQKDEKRWIIPYDNIIIKQLKIDYTRDGATIIDRLPDEGYDYHKKEESYGEYKARYLAKTEVLLQPIVELYINTLIAFKRSPKTMTTYLGPFVKFVKHIGIENMDVIVSRDIDRYMAQIGSHKVSDGYLHNAFNSIMFYYRDVLRKNDRIVNEAKRPKKADTLPTILSLGEVDRILRVMDNVKHTTILYTFYSSGIRLNEILHLRVQDMWWDRDQIMIKGGKGKKDRVVPFSGVLKELLKYYFDAYKPIYWLFEGQDQKLPYSARSVEKVVSNAVKKAAINKKVTPHTLRHCYATHLMDGGTDVRYIQELLGHSDIKTTLIYTHVTNHSLAKIQSPLDKLMTNKQNSNFFDNKFGKSESSD